MAYTSPRTWVALETVTAALLNTHLRDNLLAVAGTTGLVPTTSLVAEAATQVETVADITTTVSTTSLTMVDLTGASVSLTTVGGPTVAWWSGPVSAAAGGVFLTFALDGVEVGSNAFVASGGSFVPTTLHYIWIPSAGAHTIKVRWRVSAGTGTVDGTTARATLTVVEFKR
jgi:hypothetical protein